MTAISEIVLINDFASTNGGSAAIAVQAARQYRQLGYAVTFICGDSGNPELEALGVTVVALGSRPLLELSALQALWRGLNNRAAEQMIARWIRMNDTASTAYHLHSWAQILSPSIFRALREVDSRLVVTCHDFFNVCPNGGFSNFPKSAPCALRPLSRQCVATNCDRRSYLQKSWRVARQLNVKAAAQFQKSRSTFTFLHRKMLERFVAAGFAGSDLVPIPNPVEPWTQERIKAERNKGFLFVGRIGRDKGADLAIAAAKSAGEKLTLVGSGEIVLSESDRAAGIQRAGWLDRNGIAKIARRSRALIVPSRVVEPFGLVILEAAMSGLPVIVTSHAYLADDVSRIGCGKSFDIARPERLAQLMARYSRDHGLIVRMSHAGMAQAQNLCLTPEQWAKTFVKIFERKLAATQDPARNSAG